MNSIINDHQYIEDSFQNLQEMDREIRETVFTDCEFSSCSFTSAILRNCRFINCTFQECDLSLVQIPGSVFSGTSFNKTRLLGVDWTLADWSGVGLGRLDGFDDCMISHSTLIGLSLPGIRITRCIAHGVDFREGNFSNADFSGTDLMESLFGNTDLSGADLSKANNYDIDPGSNIIEKTRFSLPEAMALLYSMDIILDDPDNDW